MSHWIIVECACEGIKSFWLSSDFEIIKKHFSLILKSVKERINAVTALGIVIVFISIVCPYHRVIFWTFIFLSSVLLPDGRIIV